MGYSEKRIKEAIRTSEGLGTLLDAQKQEGRIRLHTENTVTPDKKAYEEFKSLPAGVLPADKFLTFNQMVTFPLQTVDFASDLVDYFRVIFRGQNRGISYIFEDEQKEKDFMVYLAKNIVNRKFEELSFNAFQYHINSVMIIDQPSEVKNPPEPYLLFKEIETIAAVIYKDHDNYEIDMIAIDYGGYIGVYDDEKYARLEKDKDGKVLPNTYKEVSHNIGYVPARWFWTTNAYKNVKKHPLSKELGNLDILLFKLISKEVADLYIPFPLVLVPPTKCNYADDKGSICSSGILVDDGGIAFTENGKPKPCPLCSAHSLTGPGSMIIDGSTSSNKATEPKYINADTAGIKYYSDANQDRKESISFYTTGRVSFKNDQAKNEKQILGAFETQTNTLFGVKDNFEVAYKWVLATMGKIIYTSEQFKGVNVSFGTEFMIFSVKDLYELYQTGRENGFDDATLDVIKERIIETENKNDEVLKNRLKFIGKLEPYRHKSLMDIIELKRAGVPFDNELIAIKANMANLVARFESENGEITKYMDKSPKQLEEIINKLKSYGSTDIRGTIEGSE